MLHVWKALDSNIDQDTNLPDVFVICLKANIWAVLEIGKGHFILLSCTLIHTRTMIKAK
jgi:hypothetical protein